MPQAHDPHHSPPVSQVLLVAALTALLGVGTVACDDSVEAPDGGGAGGGGVTLSRYDPEMTREKFQAMCDEQGGTMEFHPHCGGVNSCQGFSYDESTDVYSEHTCKGLNTCNGFSCIVP